MIYTHLIKFETPLSLNKSFIGNIQCEAILKYNSKGEYKSGDISDLQLGEGLTMKNFADWNYQHGSIEELLQPIIDSYADEGAEHIQLMIEERDRRYESIRETEKSLNGF